MVDKTSVSGTQLQDAVIRANPAWEEVAAQRTPKRLAPLVVIKASLMVAGIQGHRSQPQPNVRPQIMRKPTLRARKLLVFPPLLWPTRGWKVIGHSTIEKSWRSA